ncbi:unnamed protein product [Gongylonema pulchrum]|uniref:Uncharacterized protein n=1 Tax=Gongylonema pulchrum TaxID=637853 RepID=A0A183DY58_9BILA|nr:unnamed protein product [Gongylonema pulchrum]
MKSGALRRTVQYIGRQLKNPRKKINDDHQHPIPTGDFVCTNYLELPPGIQIQGSCFLPPDFPFQDGFEAVDNLNSTPVLQSLGVLNQALPCLFPDPFLGHSIQTISIEDTVRAYETYFSPPSVTSSIGPSSPYTTPSIRARITPWNLAASSCTSQLRRKPETSADV